MVQLSGRYLKIKDAVLDNLEADTTKEGIKEAKYKMLTRWLYKTPNATVQVLCEALEDVDRMDIIADVFGMLKCDAMSYY